MDKFNVCKNIAFSVIISGCILLFALLLGFGIGYICCLLNKEMDYIVDFEGHCQLNPQKLIIQNITFAFSIGLVAVFCISLLLSPIFYCYILRDIDDNIDSDNSDWEYYQNFEQ
jgi:presenilin-like A22 family membrane protease